MEDRLAELRHGGQRLRNGTHQRHRRWIFTLCQLEAGGRIGNPVGNRNGAAEQLGGNGGGAQHKDEGNGRNDAHGVSISSPFSKNAARRTLQSFWPHHRSSAKWGASGGETGYA